MPTHVLVRGRENNSELQTTQWEAAGATYVWPVSVLTSWCWADEPRILKSMVPCQQGQLLGPGGRSSYQSGWPESSIKGPVKVPAQLFLDNSYCRLLSTWTQDTCALSHRTVYDSSPQPFLAPGTDFVEDNFSIDQQWGVVVVVRYWFQG